MDQTVHVYILHPWFLWYTVFFSSSFFLRPLTSATNLYTHSLTHSCCLARALLLSLLISDFFSVFFPLWFIPLKTKNYRNLDVQILEQRAFVCFRRAQTFGWRLNLFLSVTCFTTAPCCVHMGSLSHIEGRGLLICAIDFLIGSAPCLVNENMLCAGNQTWGFLSEISAMYLYTDKNFFGCSYKASCFPKINKIDITDTYHKYSS